MTAVPAGSTWYHVHLGKGLLRQADELNLTEQDVTERFVKPWLEGKQVMIGGKAFLPSEAKMTIYAGPRVTTNQMFMGAGWSNAVKFGEDVTAELLAAEGTSGTASASKAAGSKRGTISSIPDVFVSHASADAKLVGEFVDTILKLGCGLKPKQIFYSSGADTGIPSGSDLIHHVRDQVGASGLVIAIISTMFQTRPVCVAELGAAWGRTDNLFPLAVPDMARIDMEGVLVGMTVRYLNDSQALDELKDRVRDVTGTDSDAKTWGAAKAKWLAMLDGLVAQLKKPESVSIDEVKRLRSDLAGTQAALSEAQAKEKELESRIARYQAAETTAERTEALLPEDEKERFDLLVREANEALRKVSPIVRDAIYLHRYQEGMPWPNMYDDPHQREEADKAYQAGTLTENSMDRLVPDDRVRDVAGAVAAVERLDAALGESSYEFDVWFQDEYGAPADLRRRDIWDQLLG